MPGRRAASSGTRLRGPAYDHVTFTSKLTCKTLLHLRPVRRTPDRISSGTRFLSPFSGCLAPRDVAWEPLRSWPSEFVSPPPHCSMPTCSTSSGEDSARQRTLLPWRARHHGDRRLHQLERRPRPCRSRRSHRRSPADHADGEANHILLLLGSRCARIGKRHRLECHRHHGPARPAREVRHSNSCTHFRLCPVRADRVAGLWLLHVRSIVGRMFSHRDDPLDPPLFFHVIPSLNPLRVRLFTRGFPFDLGARLKELTICVAAAPEAEIRQRFFLDQARS